ncbi:NADP-dependent oxidoreductase domain-containing protein [Cercophora samala]|uniref:NADP-dependent oxidoreductase domain-containing protein n=1 Tax=Cercophora samala TaxID=330535 RepID=A0AA39ZEL9_9PEZI|nr:NADP-dependent oxidoreductase domain-containing protein [Cercophora samala]
MSLAREFALINGTKVPAVGLRAFQSTHGNSLVKDTVKLALQLGYRHIDDANAHRNEREMLTNPCPITRQSVTPSAIDYGMSRRYPETWETMERLVDSEKSRAIGLSNFNIFKTKRILEVARIIPAINQVEIWSYLPHHELVKFSAKHGVHYHGSPAAEWTPCPRMNRFQLRIQMYAHLEQNLHLGRLPDHLFEAVTSISSEKGPMRFLDPSHHTCFDISDEENDQPVKNKAPWH